MISIRQQNRIHEMAISVLFSLYSSLKHLSSDSKNIKELLQYMTKYIENKSVNQNKAN